MASEVENRILAAEEISARCKMASWEYVLKFTEINDCTGSSYARCKLREMFETKSEGAVSPQCRRNSESAANGILFRTLIKAEDVNSRESMQNTCLQL